MKTLKIFTSILLLAFLAFSCQSEDPTELIDPAIEQTEMASKKKKPVPFKANFNSTVTGVTLPPSNRCGNAIGLTQNGTGNASHMGRITTVLNSCVIPPTTTFNVLLEITAANGDVLRIVDDPQGTDNDFLFAGGTGRFANATGTCVGTFSLISGTPGNPNDPPVFDTRFKGNIQY